MEALGFHWTTHLCGYCCRAAFFNLLPATAGAEGEEEEEK